MDPEREWRVRKLRCWACEARADAAAEASSNGVSFDGLYFAVDEVDLDEEVTFDG